MTNQLVANQTLSHSQAFTFTAPSYIRDLTPFRVRATPIVRGTLCTPQSLDVIINVSPPRPTGIVITPSHLSCNQNKTGYFTFGAIQSPFILPTDEVYVNYRNNNVSNSGGTIKKSPIDLVCNEVGRVIRLQRI